QRFDRKKADEKALLVERTTYGAMVSRLDRNIGRILEHLDGAGLRKNTLVIFTSASGSALGEHSLLGTAPAFYGGLVPVPLLVRFPGMAEAGMEIDRIVGLVDLAPTLLEAAGQHVPFTMQGDRLVSLLKNPRGTGHGDEEFFEYERYVSPTSQPSSASAD